MKVSVIIPVYNGEKYIKNAVNSVLSQSYDNFEVIIINDNSNDSTEKVIFENFSSLIDSQKIIYFKNDKNMERSYSRNKGFQLSKGDYIFYLDYDDEWDKDYLKENVSYLENFDIVYSFPRTFIDSEGNVKRVSVKKIPDDVGEIVFSGNIGYPSASGFKRDSFLKYDESLNYREDWEIFVRSFLSGLKIKILDNNKVKIREHSGRTSRKNIQMLKNTLLIYEKYKDKVPTIYREYLYFHIGDMCLRFGDLYNGWKFVLKSFKNKELLTSKNLVTLLKRGFRLDKYLTYSSLKEIVL
ncbi:glycosyltransferase family 2 protein [Sulfurihydrogenibium sp.]|uniref:glycosyltransferase family 2 protein n=1 Tax=Sulfurihydrogenibium sp. TaxID=2053621 RepID=UPI00262C4B75|nr:glycosyltransferase family 2 protein [Sulfurihydrogenibium sp.]